MEQHFLDDPRKILVCKNKHEIMILSRFSQDMNMVIRYIEGNENTFLLPVSAPLEAWQSGCIWAQSWDNNAPFMTARHNTIGANHGSPFAFAVDMLRHWLFNRDIGTVFTDDAGSRFVLTSVETPGRILLHSDVPEPGETFAEEICGALHGPRCTIVPEKVTRCQVSALRGEQLSPHNRYNSEEFYADGRRLADGEFALCSQAELKWDIDLILADDWLNALKSSPGKYIAPTDPGLPGAVNSKVTTTFRPKCSRTVDCELTFLRDIWEHIRTGVLQFHTEIPFTYQERVIPGIKRFTLDGEVIDLPAGFVFPENMVSSKFLTREDCIDPRRLPDRSIEFFGNGKREIGAVLGYSLTRGITARGNEAQRSNKILNLRSTKKNYPCAFERESVRKGEKFLICCYQHYFLPDDSKVSCYQLEQKDGYFVYVDFTQAYSSYAVTLPPETAGKELSILEQDGTVRLDTPGGRIPENAVLRFSAADVGSIVIRIVQDGQK